MNRRLFIQKLLYSLQTMLLMRLVHPAVLPAVIKKMESDKLHYRPLNGRSLREISLRKKHHGNGRFISPVGIPREGRWRQLLKWKLSPNSFSRYLKDQPVNHIAIDWEPVRKHQGVSVTFLKHAGVFIKDVDSYLLIDPVFTDIYWFITDFRTNNFRYL